MTLSGVFSLLLLASGMLNPGWEVNDPAANSPPEILTVFCCPWSLSSVVGSANTTYPVSYLAPGSTDALPAIEAKMSHF